jgi:hypothetical protein
MARAPTPFLIYSPSLLGKGNLVAIDSQVTVNTNKIAELKREVKLAASGQVADALQLVEHPFR